MRLSPEPQTDSNQQRIGRRCSGFPRKSRAGVLRVSFQFGLWSSVGKGGLLLPPATPRPAGAPHSFRDRMMSSSRSELSELSAAKETRGLRLVCDTGTHTGTGDGHPCPRLQLLDSAPSVFQTTQKQPGNLHQSFPSVLTTEAQGEQLQQVQLL